MKRLRWQLLIVILALAAIALLLLGQQPEVQPVDTTVDIQPVEGGIYTEGLIGQISRLNPLLDYYNTVDQDIDHLLYSRMFRFDERGNPVSDLVESWGVSQDGTVYNFSLLTSARWHDGEPVTSDDILYTIEMLRDPALPIPADLRELWDEVDVVALDTYLIQFRLPEAFAPFLDYLTFGVAPAHLLGGLAVDVMIDDSFHLSPVGSGPYQFSQFIVEDGQITGVALTASETYYGERAFIDDLVFLTYPDGPAALEAYQNGDILGISQITSDILADTLAEPNLNTYTGRLPQLSIVLLNLDNPETPFFGDVFVRRAMLQGLNRQRIIDRQRNGQAIVADGVIFPGTWAYYEHDEFPEFDSEGAISTLRTAEYTIPADGGSVRAKDDVLLAFTLVHPDTPEHNGLAKEIKRYWDQIGMDVTLEAVPYDVLMSGYLETHEYQAALVDLNLFRSPDPDPYPFWHQAQITNGQNYSQWDDRPASEYLEKARVTLDVEERARLYRNFQIRFAREIPAIPLFYPVYTYGVDAQVQGVSMGPLFSPADRLANTPYWFLQSELTEIGE